MFERMGRVQGHEEQDSPEQYWTHISGSDLLASLLPGIVTMLCKIITEPNKVRLYMAVERRLRRIRYVFLLSAV